MALPTSYIWDPGFLSNFFFVCQRRGAQERKFEVLSVNVPSKPVPRDPDSMRLDVILKDVSVLGDCGGSGY